MTHSGKPIILATLVALASCGYNATYRDCLITCATGSGCPDGLTCGTENLCHTQGIAATTPCGASPIGDAPIGDAPIVKPPSFAASVDFATGIDPQTVAIGDLNGDGKPDLAVVNYVSNTVSVFLNATPAASAQPVFTSGSDVPTGVSPLFVAIADFNEDGKPDLAVASLSAPTVSVFLNTTATGMTMPSFAAHVDFPTGQGAPAIATGDLNGDGKPDLVVSNVHTGTVSVLLNTAAMGATTPSFATTVTLTVGPADSVAGAALGDVNEDGRPDIVVSDTVSQTVSVFVNTTPVNATVPSFEPQQSFPALDSPGPLAVGDLNGDGRPDVAIAKLGVGVVSVIFDTTATGGSDVSFGDSVDFTTGAGTPSVAIADLNGDGKPDVAVTHSAVATCIVNTTAEAGTLPSFVTEPDFTTGSGTGFLAVGDLNGDGRPDFAAVLPQSNIVSILLEQ